MTRLLLYLHPVDLPGTLPKGHVPVFPLFTGVSRLEYKPDAFNFKLLSKPVKEILSLPNHQKTFAELCDDRAIELNKQVDKLYVMWSGGIDSTIAVTAILRNWSKQDLEKVTVLCNIDSIKENKPFFSFIAKNFKIELSDSNIESRLKEGFVLTGEMGDQVFGSDVPISTAKQAEDILFEDYETSAVKMYNAIKAGYGESYFELYRPIADEAPFKLKTIFDWCWWLNDTQKWQHIQLRTFASTTWKDPGRWQHKLLHFFDTDDFQIWSIHNHDKKIKQSWQSYKYIGKEYVIDYTKDSSFNNKLKLPSLQNIFIGGAFNWSIDEEWKFLNKEQTEQRMRHGN